MVGKAAAGWRSWNVSRGRINRVLSLPGLFAHVQLSLWMPKAATVEA